MLDLWPTLAQRLRLPNVGDAGQTLVERIAFEPGFLKYRHLNIALQYLNMDDIQEVSYCHDYNSR